MRARAFGHLFAAFLALGSALSATAAPVVLSDGTFADADWSTVTTIQNNMERGTIVCSVGGAAP